MNYQIEPKFHGKKLELTIDVKDTSVGDCSLLGFIVKIHKQTCNSNFEDWFKKIYCVNIINAESCFQTTSTVDGFYAFLEDYYTAKNQYHWYGGITK